MFLRGRQKHLLNAGRDDLTSYISHLTKTGRSAATTALFLSAARQFYAFAYEEGVMDDNPSEGIERPKTHRPLPKIISVDEVTVLLNQVAEDAISLKLSSLRLHALMEILYATGLRVSELCGLPRACFHPDQPWLNVIGKGNKERLVP
ncbi:MAG: tyrosine-type recombinase/integrase, partial [Pseudomonadota bacterium]